MDNKVLLQTNNLCVNYADHICSFLILLQSVWKHSDLDSIRLWCPITNLLFIYQYLCPFYGYMPTEPVIQRIYILYNKRIFLSFLLDPIGSQYIRGFVTHYVCFYVCLKKLRTRYDQISLTPLILSPPQNNIPKPQY